MFLFPSPYHCKVKMVNYNMNNFHLVSFLLGAAMAATFLLIYTSTPLLLPPPPEERIALLSTSTLEEMESSQGYLLELLGKTAIDEDTVIMTVINEAWAAPNSLLDLFLQSFHIGDQIEPLLDHLIIVAVDSQAFDRCKKAHKFCYFLKVKGSNFNSEKKYMTKDYLEIMWRRNEFQRNILELGYNFLFTDMDILWFRNPFTHISVAAHILIASDQFYGNPDDLNNQANGGFLYAKSCNKTIQFFKKWHQARERYPTENEQYVFDQIKHEFSSQLHVKIQFCDTAFFGGFCQPKKDFNKICTFHANCLVGLASKLDPLRGLLGEWKEYKTNISIEN